MSQQNRTKSVGIRELKNRLSEYVRKVRSGETVLITDRGEVVAQLNPPDLMTESVFPPEWVALARSGKITLGRKNDPAFYPDFPRLTRTITSAQLLDEERGTR